MVELRDGWTAEDFARGDVVIQGWGQGRRANSYADSFRGVLAVQANSDLLYPPSVTGKIPLGGVVLGENYALALADFKGSGVDSVGLFGFFGEGDRRKIGAAYLANVHAIRRLFNGSHRVTGGAPALALPTVPASLPVVIAVAVVGVAAVAGITWWGVDKNKREAEVSQFDAAAVQQTQIYAARVKAAIETKTPIPDPPDLIARMADAEASSMWWLLGAGAVLGALGVGGIWYGTRSAGSRNRGDFRLVRANPRHRRSRRAAPRKTSRRRPARSVRRAAVAPKRRNPARRRKAAPRLTPNRRSVLSIAYNAWLDGGRPASFISSHERAVVKDLTKLGWLKIVKRGKSPGGRAEVYAKITPKGRDALGIQSNPRGKKRAPTKRATKRKAAPKRKGNPLRSGYSRATVTANVSEMKRAGYPERQAVAASLRSARASYRKKNPRGGYPSHLQTAAERKGHKKQTRKKNAPKRKAAPKRRKRNPKAKAGARRRPTRSKGRAR